MDTTATATETTAAAPAAADATTASEASQPAVAGAPAPAAGAVDAAAAAAAEKKPKAKDFVEMRRRAKEVERRQAEVDTRAKQLEERAAALESQDTRLSEARKAFAEDPWAFFERISEESGTPFADVVEAINRRVLAGGQRTPKDDQNAAHKTVEELRRKVLELEQRDQESRQAVERSRVAAEASAAIDAHGARFPLVAAFPRERVVAAVLQTINDSGKALAYDDAMGMLEEELAQIQSAFPSRDGAAKAARPEAVAKPATLSNQDSAESVGAPQDDEDVPRWQWARRAAKRALSG